MPIRGTTPPDLSLPPELVEIMNIRPPGIDPFSAATPSMPQANPGNPGQMGAMGGAGGPAMDPFSRPGYAAGGMVGPQGMPMQQPMQQGGGMPMQQPMGQGAAQQITSADVDQFLQENPEAAQQIAMQMQQEGFTPEDAQQMDQMITTVMDNPEMYPQIRQYVIQQGMADPEELPEQYDPGYMFSLAVGARAVTMMGGGGQAAMPMNDMPNYADGGYVGPGDDGSSGGKVKGPGHGTSDSVPIRVSTGEYIIPANVVHMKGREFFDKMLEHYKSGGNS